MSLLHTCNQLPLTCLCDPSEITPRPLVADTTSITSPKLTGLAAVAWTSSPRSHGSRSRACTGLPWRVSETGRALHDWLPDLQRTTPDPQVTEAGLMDSTALGGTITAISATPYGHHGDGRSTIGKSGRSPIFASQTSTPQLVAKWVS